MSTTFSTYYDLVRVREMGPEAKNWAVTDQNYEAISLILKSLEQHTHTGIVSLGLPARPITQTVATPTVITATAHKLAIGAPVQFSTTGVMPIGLTANTTYYVSANSLTTNSFRITATLGGPDLGITAPATAQVYISIPYLTELSSGGSLSPGVVVGVRLSYTNSIGLETQATVEQDIQLSPAALRADPPTVGTLVPLTSGIQGGYYVYVITKGNVTGETEASDILAVSVPYDQAYEIPLNFDAISTYTDGTTLLNIYRSAGLNSTFQLVRQITDIHATSYIDNKTVQSATQQPPSVPTFDKTRAVNIDWTPILGILPTDAVQLNVYVTQQPGVWGNNHLLSTVDLTQPLTSIPAVFQYMGSEVLGVGYPLDTSQIPSSPSKIDLGTQATGGFVLTADGDFQSHQAKNIVIDNRSSAPTASNGAIYYDTSANQIKAYINGSWTNWGTTAGSGYTHPSEEVGGHLAGNIRWIHGGASPNLSTLLLNFFDNTGALQSQTVISSATNSSAVSINSSTVTPIPGFLTSSTAFAAFNYVDVIFTGTLILTGSTGGFVQLYVTMNGGIQSPVWRYSLQTVTIATYVPFNIGFIVNTSSTVNFQCWWSVDTPSTVAQILSNNAWLWCKVLP